LKVDKEMSGNTYVKNIVISVMLLVIAGFSFSGVTNRVVTATPLVNSLDERADEYYEESIRTALYTYAIARGLNAVISLVQDIQITPLVATIPVGQVLDPVNDLIERFSVVVLVSVASLGIQKFLMEIGSWLGINVLLVLSLLVIGVSMWLPAPGKGKGLRFGFRLVILSVIIRFCIPAVGAATGKVYDLFLKQQTEQATEAIERTRDEIEFMERVDEEALTQLPGDAAGQGAEEPGLWDRVKEMCQGGKEQMDFQAKFEEIKETLSSAVEYLVELIVIFVLQTLVIPLIVLWVIVRFARYLTGRGFDRVFP
jgi:hypothetical protein